MLARLVAGAVAGMLVATLPAFAQSPSPPAEQDIPTLPPVVVSGTRTERSAEDLPVSASVVPREQIVNSPGRSIEENLRGLAGLQLNPDNSAVIFPLIPSIAIRGTGVGDTADRVLVLVDGVPINGGFFGNIFWNRVPKETIERVEVIRGASSSLYGSYAMGGVVNIVTRAPSERSGSLSASYGQQNSVSSNLWYSDALPDKTAAFSFNGNFYQTDGFFRHDDRPPVEGRESGQLYNFQGRGDWTLTPGVKSFLRVGYNHQSTDGRSISRRRRPPSRMSRRASTSMPARSGSSASVPSTPTRISMLTTWTFRIRPCRSSRTATTPPRTTSGCPASGREGSSCSIRGSSPESTFAACAARTTRTCSTRPGPSLPLSSARGSRPRWASSGS
jgi:outer membrane receptor protein involved in Fe transport